MEASFSDGSEKSNRPWQDELCLQPLKSYPGISSQLCNLCIQVFRGGQRAESKVHVELLLTLEVSAERGCGFCNLILKCFSEHSQCRTTTRLSLMYTVGSQFSYVRFESLSLQRCCIISGEHIEASYYIPTSQYVIAGNTSSESHKAIARWWFQRCRTDHPHCTPADYSGRKFPKRLLEVGISSNGPTVKVIETQALRDEKYMTLSHCWGSSLPMRLLTTNIDTFKTSIPFSDLPKTFQDALSVVGWFGIKYLWIDALCIIQNFDDDWTHESGRMRDYYKYSFGTIAATGASDSSEGLFFDRNPAIVAPFRVLINPKGTENDVAVDARWSSWGALKKAPLFKRGWFLQERFLSPRILHFGRNHMSWECQTEVLCETWPISVSTPVYSQSSFGLKDKYTSLSHSFRKNDFQHLWGRIVFTYSRMALTRISDRSVAFAGVAEEVQAVSRDDYVAGLWRRDLPESLLWAVDISFIEQQCPNASPARSQSYLAPSWSWLSVNRAVQLPISPNWTTRDMVAIHAEVESVTENKFGAIKHGVISAWGALVPAICMADNARWRFHSIRSKMISQTDEWYNICVDEGYIEEPNGFLYCLPILDSKADNSDSGQVHGLLVVPTLKTIAEYRRIGNFDMRKPEAYDFLEVPGALTDDLNGEEFETFTLV